MAPFGLSDPFIFLYLLQNTNFTVRIANACTKPLKLPLPKSRLIIRFTSGLLFPYVEAANIVSGKVLEIGCGWGRGLELLTKAANQYIGIDKNQELISALSAEYPNATFIAANIPPLSGLADNTFDFIVTFQVIEHIENDDLFIKEAHRVLKPGGKLLLTTVNKTFSLTRNPWHVREYYADGLKSLMAKYFPTVDTKGIHGNGRR
jgi:ubiquinone/menaquinone biosynthesis C-methylase UbiE